MFSVPAGTHAIQLGLHGLLSLSNLTCYVTKEDMIVKCIQQCGQWEKKEGKEKDSRPRKLFFLAITKSSDQDLRSA